MEVKVPDIQKQKTRSNIIKASIFIYVLLGYVSKLGEDPPLFMLDYCTRILFRGHILLNLGDN